ncbi:MAG: protein kinase [Gammaproteobacteria bacterium]|nr:protein kinase [Gammaproteobacteria bacterium]
MRKTPVTYKSEETFIGYTAAGNFVSTVTADELAIATEKLKDTPSGTKLRCYDYDDENPPHYFYPEKPAEKFSLSHTFIIIKNAVYAISNEHHGRIPFSAHTENITPAEWRFAEHYFFETDALTSAKKQKHPEHSKLRHRQKVWVDDTLRHSFIKIDYDPSIKTGYEIYAMSGPGWGEFAGTAKIKAATQKVALKSAYKWFVIQNDPELFINEYHAAFAAKFLLQAAWKNKTAQPIYIFPLYQTDFQYFMMRNIACLNEPTTPDNIISIIEKQYFFILLNTVIELQIIHQRRILHRDIKLENILVNVDLETNDIKSKICDYGFATFMDSNGFKNDMGYGTERYMAPEITGKDAQGNTIPHYDCHHITFSAASDIYALGQCFSFVRSNLKSIPAREILKLLFTAMTHQDPLKRILLCYVQIALAHFLYQKHGVVVGAVNFSPLKTKRGSEFIFKILEIKSALTPEKFSDTQWLEIITTLENDLLLSDAREKAEVLFSYFEKKTQNSFFSLVKLEYDFFIYGLLREFNIGINVDYEKLPSDTGVENNLKTLKRNFDAGQKTAGDLEMQKNSSRIFNAPLITRIREIKKQNQIAREEIIKTISGLIPEQLSSPTHGA